MKIPKEDIDHLVRDKYDGDAHADISADLARLEAGEPLAYVIGWIPFLGLRIDLSSHPLIPRPETEWWTELLVKQIGDRPLRVLDLCAGSGAIGLAVLKHCPNAKVYFGELEESHIALIKQNLVGNGLDASRADIRAGDLFTPFSGETFDVIAANPPYVPSQRTLEESVTQFEPANALYAGEDGLEFIRRIATDIGSFVTAGSELWLECDESHADMAAELLCGDIRTDLYGRKRLVLAYY